MKFLAYFSNCLHVSELSVKAFMQPILSLPFNQGTILKGLITTIWHYTSTLVVMLHLRTLRSTDRAGVVPG